MLPALCLLLALVHAAQTAVPGPTRVKVFLDCTDCFADYLREETSFVDFVRDRDAATVHVIVTSTPTGSGGREYVLSLKGLGRFAGKDATLKAVTNTGDPEDVRRRQLLTALRIALLPYIAGDGVPQGLTVDVDLAEEQGAALSRSDGWHSWVFSLRGSGSVGGQESSHERQLSAELSADRITPDWKTTFGLEVEHEDEEFDVDEDEPVSVQRRRREFDGLIVKALGEHWSVGGKTEISSSTFDNTQLRVEASPAIEFNVFPYSTYQRRQLRMQYAAGVRHQRYYEETLLGKLDETLPGHELSVTYDQRERWGAVEGQVEWFQYLHDPSKSRIEANGELSWRILRGLSVSAEAYASRIRDQISLRRRGATAEEILLRLRELQSGYQYHLSLGFTYSFGSIFSSIVNPRFGQ